MNNSTNNPYEAPSMSLEGEGVGPRRTRWRIIPVVFLSVFGGMYALFSPFLLFAVSRIPAESGGGITVVRALGCLLLGMAGIGSLYSARCCWRGRWALFAVVLAASIAAGLFANHVLSDIL